MRNVSRNSAIAFGPSVIDAFSLNKSKYPDPTHSSSSSSARCFVIFFVVDVDCDACSCDASFDRWMAVIVEMECVSLSAIFPIKTFRYMHSASLFAGDDLPKRKKWIFQF